jgi:hypothetical protein
MQMKQSVVLTVASMMSILLLTFHLTDDIVRGFEKGGLTNLTAVPICVVWVYVALTMGGTASGLRDHPARLVARVPVIHMMGRGVVGVAGSIGHTRGAFFFVWTLIAIGVTSLLSVVLSVRGLWGLRRR